MSKKRARKSEPGRGGHPAAQSQAARARETSEPGVGDRAAIALWVTLALLLAARAAFAFVPGTWAWALGAQRFLPPAVAWLTWLLAALALAPAIARRATPVLTSWGDAIARRPATAAAAWALTAAALAFLMPDQVRFVGDFLLRQGTVEVAELPGNLYPQALPFDVFLHYHLPLRLTETHMLDANGAARVLGVVEAALMATFATAFARTLELRGGAAFATAAVVLFGGYLGMFTGFSKAFAEMCVLIALAGASAIAALRTGRGLLPLGIAVAVAITLHRSALGMLPALAMVWGLWFTRHGRTGAWRRASVLLGVALPLASFAIMAPRIIGTVIGIDTAVHFAPPEVKAQGGVLASALAGLRPLDFANLALMLSPFSLAIVPLAACLGRRAGRNVELLVLALLALPFVAVMAFIHPAQGLYRDWDDFAATGVTLSLVAAWLVGTTLKGSPRFGWLALAVTLGVAVPAVQWLWVHTDTARGLARVRAFVSEPPQRTGAERGMTWDYLGIRNFRLQRYAEAQAAFTRAVETSPSPRILQEWAVAASMAGDLKTAQDAHRRLLAVSPDNTMGWLGLAAVSIKMGDMPEAKRAATRLLQLDPSSAEARAVLDEVARHEALEADSLRNAARGAPPGR